MSEYEPTGIWIVEYQITELVEDTVDPKQSMENRRN